jgi:tetratricopeptide (TPR) repeat protein
VRDSDLLLTAEELRVKRHRRRRWLVLAIVIVLLIPAGYFGYRPARDHIKAWQARRHAQRAFALIDKEQWSDARNEAVAALQLGRNEPQAIRAVARFLTRTRQPDALEFWTELGKIDNLTREDLRDEAAIALMASEMTRAERAERELLGRPGAGPADWLLAAQLAVNKGAPQDAQTFLDRVFADARATPREQLQAAVLQIGTARTGSSTPAEREALAWSRIEKLSTDQGQVGLDALVLLGQRALSTQGGGTTAVPAAPKPGEGGSSEANAERSTPNAERPNQQSEISNQQSIVDLAHRLQNHPLARAQHKLLALDLEIHADESKRDVLIARGIADWKNGDTTSLTALAVWLNGKREYEQTLDAIPLEKAAQSRDLFLQRLDALAALNRWSEVQQLLVGGKFPLDPVVQAMYLARCSAQLGEKAAAENNWRRALEAAGGDVGKLMSLGEYAEKNGNLEIADAAYNNAVTASPKLRIAQQSRLRIAQRNRDTKKMRAVLADMLAIWPDDTAVQNDEAYTRLLLLGATTAVPAAPKPGQAGSSQNLSDGTEPVPPTDNQELITIEQVAEKLLEREPASLPHRTLLALARLKQGRANDALRVYENVQVAPSALTGSALAVHSAVLEATGHHDDAETEKEKIDINAILPEEAALVQK